MSNPNNFDDPNSFFDRVLTGSSNQSQFWSRRSFWGAILMTAAILVLVSVIWLSYIGAPEVTSEEQLPLIRASNENVRVAPENPGGREIPNRDSTVFNALREDAPAIPQVENLLAPKAEDEPIEREQLLEQSIDLNDPDAVREAMIRKAEEHAKAVQEQKADADAENVDDAYQAMPERGQFAETERDTTPEETLEYVRSVLDREEVKTIHPVEKGPETQPEVETKPAAKPTPAKQTQTQPVTTTPKAVNAGNRYVQLGSFKSQSAAQDQWAKMKKDFPGLLDGLTLRVQKADLGDKGVYYRVQAGSVSDASAKDICATINAKRSGSCILVK